MTDPSDSLLVRRIGKEEGAVLIRIAEEFARNRIPGEHASSFLQNENNLVFAAFLGGEIAGVVTAHWLDRFKDLRKQIFIYEIDVAPAHRREGVGRQLVAAVLDYARSERVDEVFVLTDHSNIPAINLYRSVGGVAENGDDLMFVFDTGSSEL